MAQGTTKGVPIDVDPTLAADSDLLVPSQKAIKTYVDTNFLNPSDLSATTPLTYSSSTGVFTINQASGSSNGYLTSTDWSTFNGKQDPLVSGTNIKTINGDSILGSGNELIFNFDRAKYGFEVFTDFLTPITTGTGESYAVFTSGASAAVAPGITAAIRTINQQGFIQISSGSTATGVSGIYGSVGASTNFISIGGGAISFMSSIYINTNLSTSTERYRIVIGFGNAATNTSDSYGIFFTYDEGGVQNGTSASPNWQCVTSLNSVRTLTVTSVAVSIAWTKLSIEINAAGTSVDFLIDNAVVATHTTNIPTGTSNTIVSKLSIAKSIGTGSRSFFSDYFGYKQIYTTSRI